MNSKNIFLTDTQIGIGFEHILTSFLFYILRDTTIFQYVVSTELYRLVITNNRVRNSMYSKGEDRGIKFEKQLFYIMTALYFDSKKHNQKSIYTLAKKLASKSRSYVVDLVEPLVEAVKDPDVFDRNILDRDNIEMIKENIMTYYNLYNDFKNLVIETIINKFSKNIPNLNDHIVYIINNIPKYIPSYMNFYSYVKKMIQQSNFSKIIQERKTIKYTLKETKALNKDVDIDSLKAEYDIDNKTKFSFIKLVVSHLDLDKKDYLAMFMPPIHLLKYHDKIAS